MARLFPKAPVKLKDIFKGFQEVKKETEVHLNILVVGGNQADQNKLVDILVTLPSEKRVFTFFNSKKERQELNKTLEGADFVLLMVEPKRIFEEFTIFLTTLLSQAKKPFLFVLKGDAREDWGEKLERVFSIPSSKVIFSPFEKGQVGKLIQKISKELPGKETVLGKSLSLFREEAAQAVVKKTSFENAFVSALTFLPGSDLPVLTLNEFKMVLRIAAIFGEEIDFSRGRELLAVLGGGFTCRSLSRSLLNLFPSLSWILKSAVAYGGTQALGKLTTYYFQNGLSHLSLQDVLQQKRV